MSRVLVRAMRDGEEPAVVRLLQRAFGVWPRDAIAADPTDHLRWKVVPRPELRRYQLVAEVDGHLAGAFFVIDRRSGVAGVPLLEPAPSPARAALRAAGFLRGPQVRLLARAYGDDRPDLRFLCEPRPAVHVSSGDSDHV